MVWEPFALAVVMGLLVSAGIYFIVMWPQVEPADDLPDEVATEASAAADPAAADPADPVDPADPADDDEPTGDRPGGAVSSDA